MSQWRLFVEWVCLLVAAILLVCAAHTQGWFERLDLQLFDVSASFASGDAPDTIVLVQIDDASLQGIGTWPWNRALHARLLKGIARAQPKAVAVDILFVEPGDEAGDTELGGAIAKAGNVALPLTFQTAPDTLQQTVPLLPTAQIARGAARLGHVAVTPDIDGNLRTFALSRTVDGVRFRHLALSTAEIGRAKSAPQLADLPDEPSVIYSPAGNFQTISAIDVLEGRVPAEFLRDKYVLVGATAQGLGDRYAVPDYAGRIMSGVEIQANILAAITHNQLVTRMTDHGILALQLSAVILLFLLFWKGAPRSSLIGAIALIVGLVTVAVFAVVVGHIRIPVAAACTAILLAYPVWNWRRLTAVSSFLDREARKLAATHSDITNGREFGFDVVARQVAQLKRLTKEVQQNLALTESVLNGSPDPMMVVDNSLVVTLINDPGKAIFGEVASHLDEGLGEIIARSGGTMDPASRELAFGDGRTFLVARAPLDPQAGSEILSFRDISGLKEAERKQRELLEFLSHDMRSPQVAIIGLAKGNTMQIDDAEKFVRIEEQARRTLKLTDDFVQIARLESDGLRMEDTELASLLAEVVDRAFSQAASKSITLALDGADEPAFAMVDPVMLSRAIDNLVGNAVKFSPEGSKVSLMLREIEGARVTISVSDEGPGLPAERLVDPFAKFGAHDTRAGPSAGLGLAFVKKTIDQHGGTVSVTSTESGGTVFLIVLPSGSS